MQDEVVTNLVPLHRKNRSQDGYSGPRQPQTHFLPTLFDRLCDNEPSQSSEVVKAYALDRQQLRQIILRDLMDLLNTTNIDDQIKHIKHEHARRSSINYGVAPLAGTHILEKHWISVEKIIRQAIVNFEPRLSPATLSIRPIIKKDGQLYNVLSFEISGIVHIQPYPMDFTVQSNVDLETNRIELGFIN